MIETGFVSAVFLAAEIKESVTISSVMIPTSEKLKAVWMIASYPMHISDNWEAVEGFKSKRIVWAEGPLLEISWAFCSVLTVQVTSWPWASKLSRIELPKTPVVPVKKTLIFIKIISLPFLLSINWIKDIIIFANLKNYFDDFNLII
ncbi:unnamed protein product [Blepharisma stoltei]|uniref:Uncharacterized protein n=1 Tax=Blepharisma stoltei TaxID=1481888 RepID=A0AAU9JIQ7_9CILI|nr:unnamed protein product [Blepharisma stoltei]